MVSIRFQEHCNITLKCICNITERKVMKVCGLSWVPNRITFDRGLGTTFRDVNTRISAMRSFLLENSFVDPYVVSADDSTLSRLKDISDTNLLSMTEGAVVGSPSGIDIDTDSRWGFGHIKDWVFR